MKIVDKKKFIKRIGLIIAVISLLFICFTNISFSKGNIKTKTISVVEGDTLWNIASEEQSSNAYYSDKDIRDIVYEIRKINNLENSTMLNVGQKLIVKSL